MLSPKYQILWNKTYIFLNKYLPLRETEEFIKSSIAGFSNLTLFHFLIFIDLLSVMLVFLIIFKKSFPKKNQKKNLNFNKSKKKTKNYEISNEEEYENISKEMTKWGRRNKDFNTEGELSYLSKELQQLNSDLEQENLDRYNNNNCFRNLSKKERLNKIFGRDLNKLDNQVMGYKKRYRFIKEQKNKDDQFKIKIAQIESEINNQDNSSSLLKRFNLVETHNLGKLPPYEQIEIQKELDHIKELLSKSDTDSFLSKVKNFVIHKKENEVEKKAISLVRKISKKIEGDHPIPPIELDRVTDELKQIKEELQSEV